MEFVTPFGISLPLVNIEAILVAEPSAMTDPESGEKPCIVKTLTEYPAGRNASKISVAAVQSTDATITRVLRLLGEGILKNLGPANFWRGNRVFDDMLVDAGVSRSTLANFKKANMQVMTSGLYDGIDRSLLGGNKIPRKFQFLIGAQRPSHLTYFTFCYIEDPQVQQPRVQVKNDTAFENGAKSATSFFYQLPDGNYWSGQVTKEGNTYTANNLERTKLRVKRTTNAKIIDFRSTEKIADVPVMEDFANEKKRAKERAEGLRPALQGLEPSENFPHPYVSDMFLATRPSRDVGFSFMVNFEDLIFNNSDYGKLWRTQYEDLKGKLVGSSTIEEIKVWRQAVKKVPNQRGYIEEKNSSPVLVAQSSQPARSKLVSGNQAIRERENIASPGNIRTFDVVDTSIVDNSRGCYRYWASIKTKDGTRAYFRKRSDRLRRFHTILKNYSEEILTNKILPHRQRMYKGQNGYMAIYDSLTPDFAALMRDKYWPTINKGKDDYLKTLFLFEPPSGELSVLDTNNLLINLLDPDSTGLDNIQSVLKMVEDLIDKISSIFKDLNSTSSASPANTAGSASSKISQTTTIKNFKTLVDFSMHDLGGYEYLTSEAKVTESQPALREFSGQAFLTRLQRETLKYFVKSTPNMDLGKGARNKKNTKSTARETQTVAPQGNSYKKNLYSYLSPSRITYGNPRNSFTSIDVSGEQTEVTLRLVENKLKANRIAFDKTGFPLPEDDRFTELIQDLQSDNPRFASDYMQNFILQSLGMSALGQGFSSAIKKISCAIEDSDDIERRDEFSAKPANNLSAAGQMPSSLAQFVQTTRDRNRRGKKQYVNYSKKRISKNLISRMSTSDLGSLPNQLAAFFLTNSDNPQDVKLTNNSEMDLLSDSRYSSTSLFNYRLIVAVEYLVGFEKSNDGKLLMSSPKWEKLNPENYAGLAGKSVLCRLVKYTDSEAADKTQAWPESMDMKIYNEYFYLKPESPQGALTAQPAEFNRKIRFPSTKIPANPFRRNIESGTTSLDRVIPPVRQRVAVQNLATLEALSSDLKGTSKTSPEQAKEEYRTTILSLKEKANRGILTKDDVKRIDKFRKLLTRKPKEIRQFTDIVKSLKETAKEDMSASIVTEETMEREAPKKKKVVETKPVQKTRKTTTRRVRKRTRREKK